MRNFVSHRFTSLGVVALWAGLAAGCGGPSASGEPVAGRIVTPPIEVAAGVVTTDVTDTEGNTFALRQD